jgi:hypothetical protein
MLARMLIAIGMPLAYRLISRAKQAKNRRELPNCGDALRISHATLQPAAPIEAAGPVGS